MYQTTYDSPLGTYHASFRRVGHKWFGWLYQDGRPVWGCEDWQTKKQAMEEIDLQAKRWSCVPVGHRRVC